MNLKITTKHEAPLLSKRTVKLFDDAKESGFTHLGWLTVTMFQPISIAGFKNREDDIVLAFLGSDEGNPFEPRSVDMVSHLDGPRKLTTTTYSGVMPQSVQNVFKYAYPGASIGELLKNHRQHISDLSSHPVLFVRTLADLETSIRDYVEFEEQAAVAAIQQSMTEADLESESGSELVDANDPFSAIRAAGTDGANYELNTEAIITRLTEWQSLCSFRIVGAKHDSVEIVFETLPSDMDAFVRNLHDFCPDLVDQGTGFVHELLEMMADAGKKPSAEMQELIKGVNFEDADYGLEILKRDLQRKKQVTLWWD